MAVVSPSTFTTSLVMRFGVPLSHMSEDEFAEFCQLNRDVRVERSRNGEVAIMPPTCSETGLRNSSLTAQLWIWNQSSGAGFVFDSSTGFRLPNSAHRSPDTSWIRLERWSALSNVERRRFAPLTPDFVAELLSPTDRIDDLRAKMREYIECGVRLGWLIDPDARRVEVYRPGQQPQELDHPATMSGDPELPGFVLELNNGIW